MGSTIPHLQALVQTCLLKHTNIFNLVQSLGNDHIENVYKSGEKIFVKKTLCLKQTMTFEESKFYIGTNCLVDSQQCVNKKINQMGRYKPTPRHW